MLAEEFIARIRSHQTLHPGVGPRDDRLYLVYLSPDGIRVGWELEPSTVLDHAWQALEDVLCGRRRAEIMGHFARIVGYYSNMRNWNPSKRAEHRDRARGNYAVPEPKVNAA